MRTHQTGLLGVLMLLIVVSSGFTLGLQADSSAELSELGEYEYESENEPDGVVGQALQTHFVEPFIENSMALAYWAARLGYENQWLPANIVSGALNITVSIAALGAMAFQIHDIKRGLEA